MKLVCLCIEYRGMLVINVIILVDLYERCYIMREYSNKDIGVFLISFLF